MIKLKDSLGIKIGNLDVNEIKLNNNIIYTKSNPNPYYLEYTINPRNNTDTIDSHYDSRCYYYLPKIYKDSSNYSINGYESIEIYKNDGKKTSDLKTLAKDVKKIIIYYKSTDIKVSFDGDDSGRYGSEIKELKYINTNNFTDMASIFRSSISLISVYSSNWETSNVTNMSSMFSGCSSLTSLDVSNFDTSNVTNMTFMFYGCSSLTSLDLSNFNTSNVKYMNYMFGSLPLTSLDLSSFNTSSVTSMEYMFFNCTSLTSLDVSNFDTSNVTRMSSMFSFCESLTSLDLSNFDTSSVTNMSSMFQYCESLTSLDLSSFDTNKVTSYSNMFKNVPSTCVIKVGSKWKLTESQTGFSGTFTRV